MQVNSAEPSTSSPDGPSVRIPVDVRRFPWIRRLAADYAYDFRSVAPFFSGDPADRGAWADAIARTQAHDRRRDDIAAVIARQQERRGAPARAREAGRILADRKTVAVVTGQQAGLFGGPLFTLFKALTAIKLAEQVSRDHNVPAVAIFWIDAEDHDWEEVRSCTVFDEALAPRGVSLPARPGAEPAPVATITLDGPSSTPSTKSNACSRPRNFASRSSPASGARTRQGSAWPTRSAAGWKRSSAIADSSCTTRRT